MRRTIIAALVALALLAGCAPTRWFKGNTHTHTCWSDGDAAPEMVADWYKSHGYDFLVLSDHNILSQGEKWIPVKEGTRLTPAKVDAIRRAFGDGWVVTRESNGVREMKLKTLPEMKARLEEPGRFLFIQGEEISDHFEKKPIHHGSINQTNVIPVTGGTSVRDVMQRTVRAVEEEARRTGKPVLVHLNHPNFHWAITYEDLAHVKGERFFEVLNGHGGVRNYGDATHPSTERIWDEAMTLRLGTIGGPPILALGSDDAHTYFHPKRSGAPPGRAWIMVRAKDLTAESIVRAIEKGDFYASSGVTLKSVEYRPDGMTVRIAGQEGVTYKTQFIGSRVSGDTVKEAGVILQEIEGLSATYRFKGDELYVRATVLSDKRHPDGHQEGEFEKAWAQPVVVRRLVD